MEIPTVSQDQESRNDRRELIKCIGAGAVILPFAGLSACSADKEPPAAKAPPVADAPPPPKSKPTERMAPAADAAPEKAAMAGPAKLTEDDPQAMSLGYVHDATSVDPAKYPRFEASQACANCALFTEGDGGEWGGCSIFPGKQVKAAGWCNVYAPK